MIVGVDFDNTIVGYDRLFHTVAVEYNLVPMSTVSSKNGVRDYLRRIGNEDAWTELQGVVYGPRMSEAEPLPCVIDSLTWLRRFGVQVFIISHKTRHPYFGPQYDLHNSAWRWLELKGFFDRSGIGLTTNEVFFEPTKHAKLSRIAALSCTHFIDDLPEILTDSDFPVGVGRILFDPSGAADVPHIHRAKSWSEIPQMLSSEFRFTNA
jgi:hypothetical protein